MPYQKHNHWYNFVVPLSGIAEFEKKVKELKSPLHEYEAGRVSEIGLVADLVFTSKSPRTPRYIKRLMKDYDGVDIIKLERE